MKKTVKRTLSILLTGVAAVSVFGLTACTPENQPQGENGGYNTVYQNDGWGLSGETSDYYYLDATKTDGLEKGLPDKYKTKVVTAGDYVPVSVPVFIDGKSNVLEVTYTVFVRGGDKIEIKNNAFFATDGRGYDVVYSVKMFDGTTRTETLTISVEKAGDLFVGDDFTVDINDLANAYGLKGDFTFADLNGNNAYDLSKLLEQNLDEAKMQKFNEIVAGRTVGWELKRYDTGETVSVTGNIADFTKIEKAYYRVSAVADSVNMFSLDVDFYDSSAPLEWNSVSKNALSYIVNNNAESIPDVSVVSAANEAVLSGREGSYIKFDGKLTKAANYYVYSTTLQPKHSKRYYEQMIGKECMVNFDVYADTPNSLSLLRYYGYLDGASQLVTYHGQITSNVWHTVSVPLDKILERWDTFFNLSDGSLRRFFAPTGNLTSGSADNCAWYFGNFTVTSSDLAEGIAPDLSWNNNPWNN